MCVHSCKIIEIYVLLINDKINCWLVHFSIYRLKIIVSKRRSTRYRNIYATRFALYNSFHEQDSSRLSCYSKDIELIIFLSVERTTSLIVKLVYYRQRDIFDNNSASYQHRSRDFLKDKQIHILPISLERTTYVFAKTIIH